MKRIIAGLLLAATPLCALAVDAQALARFDVGYARCEALTSQMAGHRDEAYLSLWRVKVTDKARADLAALRRGKVYQAEYPRAVARLEKKKSVDTDQRLKQQCQATWAQTRLQVPAASK